MVHDEGRVARARAALRRLERSGHVLARGRRVLLDRRTPPRAGDRVLVLRGGAPSVECYPVADRDAPGTWVVGVLRVVPRPQMGTRA